jgi:GNAT superfamily N-acetyltransferase
MPSDRGLVSPTGASGARQEVPVTVRNFWLARIGQRVAVLHKLEDGTRGEAVGDLEDVGLHLRLASRSGPVLIPLERVIAGRTVPPRPSRPGPPHLVTSITDLQRVMAWHWQAPESQRSRGWLLRAADGFTGRANSAIPLDVRPRPAGPAIADDLALIRSWYTARSLVPTVCVAGPLPGGTSGDEVTSTVRAAALAAGWQVVPGGSALVMTARASHLRSTLPPVDLPAGLSVTVGSEPDEAWLANYGDARGDLPEVATALLLSASEQIFVSIREDGRTVGVARGSLGGGWAGLTAVEVAPSSRRRGLGTALLRTVADWAHATRTPSVFLQVNETNEIAQSMYRRTGFDVHHRYDYLRTLPE